jgi:hypothetical protein
MKSGQWFLYLVTGRSRADPDWLLIVDRSPGMHQVMEDEEELQLTPEDQSFLGRLRIAA